MPTITDIVLEAIPQLLNESVQQSLESKKVLAELREKLLLNDWIMNFDRLPEEYLADKSMICIDGGRTETTYQVGDLIVTGATVGQSYFGKKLYTEETLPSEAFVGLPAHSSDNIHLAGGMMALQELRVLATTAKDADIRVIDGRYLGSIGELLTRLVSDNKNVVNTLLSRNFFDDDGLLQSAIKELLYPSRTNMGKIIAVVKNDSNKIYGELFKERWGIDVGSMSDRMIADRILKPGEFLTPRWLDSNGRLIGVLKTKVGMENYNKGVSNKILLDSLVRQSIQPLEMLRSQEFDKTLEGVLWSTYFKPSVWTENEKSIRIEYPFYPSNSEGINYKDFCRKMVQTIDIDIVSTAILEPVCQWDADKQAKKVSDATKLATYSLETNMEDEDLYRMKSYRT